MDQGLTPPPPPLKGMGPLPRPPPHGSPLMLCVGGGVGCSPLLWCDGPNGEPEKQSLTHGILKS